MLGGLVDASIEVAPFPASGSDAGLQPLSQLTATRSGAPMSLDGLRIVIFLWFR